jgi:hypothetical protein
MGSVFDRGISKLEMVVNLVGGGALSFDNGFHCFPLKNSHFLLDLPHFTCIFHHRA